MNFTKGGGFRANGPGHRRSKLSVIKTIQFPLKARLQREITKNKEIAQRGAVSSVPKAVRKLEYDRMETKPSPSTRIYRKSISRAAAVPICKSEKKRARKHVTFAFIAARSKTKLFVIGKSRKIRAPGVFRGRQRELVVNPYVESKLCEIVRNRRRHVLVDYPYITQIKSKSPRGPFTCSTCTEDTHTRAVTLHQSARLLPKRRN